MKLLTSLLLLLAVSSFAAQPSYQAFRGTGGIGIVSNPPNGTIIIDGSGISSPTGGVSAATATNIAEFYSTNTTGRAAPPLSSVQFNSNGVVQGSAGLIYSNSVLFGNGGGVTNVGNLNASTNVFNNENGSLYVAHPGGPLIASPVGAGFQYRTPVENHMTNFALWRMGDYQFENWGQAISLNLWGANSSASIGVQATSNTNDRPKTVQGLDVYGGIVIGPANCNTNPAPTYGILSQGAIVTGNAANSYGNAQLTVATTGAGSMASPSLFVGDIANPANAIALDFRTTSLLSIFSWAPMLFCAANGTVTNAYFDNSGNVAIGGSTAPSSKLDVNGQVRAASAIFTNTLDVTQGTATAQIGTLKVMSSAGINALYLTNLSGSGDILMIEADGRLGRTNITVGGSVAAPVSSIQFNSNGVVQGSANLVYTNGFIGVGTPAPQTMLSVSNLTATAPSFRVHSSNNPTPAFQIASNGAVSMGTASFVSGARLTLAGGPILFLNDNTDDIGASGANRPRAIYAGTRVTSPDMILTTGPLFFGSGGVNGSINTVAADKLGLVDHFGTGSQLLIFGPSTTAAFPAIGRQAGDVVILGADGNPATATNRLILPGGLVVGPTNSTVTLTNVLYATATLDFPSTLAQTDFDTNITVVGASPGDIVSLGAPTNSLTGSTYTAFASNDTVFVRFSVYGLAAKDPAPGVFRVRVDKFK